MPLGSLFPQPPACQQRVQRVSEARIHMAEAPSSSSRPLPLPICASSSPGQWSSQVPKSTPEPQPKGAS